MVPTYFYVPYVHITIRQTVIPHKSKYRKKLHKTLKTKWKKFKPFKVSVIHPFQPSESIWISAVFFKCIFNKMVHLIQTVLCSILLAVINVGCFFIIIIIVIPIVAPRHSSWHKRRLCHMYIMQWHDIIILRL